MSALPGFAGEVVSNLHVSVWRQAATVVDVVELGDQLARLAERHARIGILLVVPEGVPLSPDSARKSASAMLRELGDSIASIALVIEGGGFGTAAVRSMFTGLAILMRPPWAWKMFAQTWDAAAWTARELSHGPEQLDADTIDITVEVVRGRARRMLLAA